MHCLFFYFSVAPEFLLSFPTRRSSDLAVCRLRRGACPRPQPSRGEPYHESAGSIPPSTARPSPQVVPHRWRLDRKSTRLNSSHRCISYAVFCLKKKTTRHSKQSDNTQR